MHRAYNPEQLMLFCGFLNCFFCTVSGSRRLLFPLVDGGIQNLRSQILSQLRVFFQEFNSLLTPLTDALAFTCVPSTRFIEQLMFYAQVENITFERDSITVHKIKFYLSKRRSHFVLNDFHSRTRTNDVFAVFDCA